MLSDYRMIIRSSLARGLLPKADMGISARVMDLRWSVTTEGGYQTAEIGLSASSPWPIVGSLPRGIEVELYDDVTIQRGGRTVFEGRILELDIGAGGLPVGILVEGYMAALNDDWSRNTSSTSITSGAALQSIIAAVAPDLRIGNDEQWIDPNVTHAETLIQTGTDAFGSPVYAYRGGMYDFYKLTAGQAVDLVLKEGSDDKQPLVFMVLANRTCHLFPLVAPAKPTYTTAFDPTRMTWRESARGMVSHATVEYQIEINTADKTYELDVTSEAQTDGFLDAHGIEKHRLIPAGTMLEPGAVALRDTTLTRGSQPSVQSTITATDDPTTWLTRSGARWPYDAVLPGEWVEVAERGLQPIIAVSVDASAGVATYELGELDPYLSKNMFIKERKVSGYMALMLNFFGGRQR